MITTSDFTKGAIEEAISNPNNPTILINGEKLLDMCIENGIGFTYKPVLVKEAKDFGRIIKKWEVLSNNLVADTSVPMVLPDLLWVSKPGVGKTHLLKLLSEYLYERKNLMEFYGNVKYEILWQR
mgnify:CR=1 FL=1